MPHFAPLLHSKQHCYKGTVWNECGQDYVYKDFKKPRHRIQVKDSIVKEEDKFVYLGSSIN